MRLPEDYEEQSGMSMSVVAAVVSVTIFIALIFVIVIIGNMDGKKSSAGSDALKQSIAAAATGANSGYTDYPDTEQLLSGSSLSPEDLDFWDKYPDQTQESVPENEPPKESGSAPDKDKDKDTSLDEQLSDGYHTLVTYADGSQEWVAINSDIPANTYELTSLIRHGNSMKYFVDNKEVSKVGVSIYEELDYVDFSDLRKAGVDYCMIKVGARGYSTGKLVMDDNFKDNMKRAKDAGLQLGVYFFSQAISTAEAEEEARLVLEYIKDYDIDYPVVYEMGFIVNDDSRIDELTKNEKTKIAKAFLDVIKAAGYKTALCGTKEWLIQEINLLKLSEYDVWLNEPGELPDYPYKFTMWKYTDSAVLDGISGYAEMSISFIDYSQK